MKDGNFLTIKEKAFAVIAIALIVALGITVCYQSVIISKSRKIINQLTGSYEQTENNGKVVWLNPEDNERGSSEENTKSTENINTADTTSSGSYDVNGKTDYVLNTSSKKIHSPSCPSVDETKDKNKRSVSWDEEEFQQALNEGYKPCGRCNAGR